MLSAMNRGSMHSNWLYKASLGYLLLPFIIFCLTFLKVWIGIPVVALLSWITWRIWKQIDKSYAPLKIRKSDLTIGLIVLGCWVVLSGIGGFAFQNPDHHIRNAILRDLINYDWPVYYPPSGVDQNGSPYALIYYIGFWLPAALIGKLFGWQSANIALFLWSWVGVTLTAIMMKERIKSSLLGASLLLIFFSGMDIMGKISIQSFFPSYYPTIWPPTTEIEWWAAGSFQFSSFTTQLFWVFNQAIPAWICFALVLLTLDQRFLFFIWALCLFFAPLPALGLLPYIILTIPNKAFQAEKVSFRWQFSRLREFLINGINDIKIIITHENVLGGGIILVISLVYFSANPNASNQSVQMLSPLLAIFYVIFLIYEFFLLWRLFFREQKSNLWWYVTGGLCVIIPLIRFGGSIDFCMRASIPALFLLMIWSGESLFRKPAVKYRGALLLLLILGAITPIYEINRSVYRTAVYYFGERSSMEDYSLNQSGFPSINTPELDHPDTLTADYYPSLSMFNPEEIPNFVGKIGGSFFFDYLAPPP